MDGLKRSELESLRQAMLLGTARRPLAPPPALASLIAAAPAATDPTLPLLALVGQHGRFERPAPSAPLEMPEAAVRLHSDPRPILPEPMRRLLGRLADWVNKDWSGAVVLVALRQGMAAGVPLHPFDLPRLLPFLQSKRGSSGPAEAGILHQAETR